MEFQTISDTTSNITTEKYVRIDQTNVHQFIDSGVSLSAAEYLSALYDGPESIWECGRLYEINKKNDAYINPSSWYKPDTTHDIDSLHTYNISFQRVYDFGSYKYKSVVVGFKDIQCLSMDVYPYNFISQFYRTDSQTVEFDNITQVQPSGGLSSGMNVASSDIVKQTTTNTYQVMLPQNKSSSYKINAQSYSKAECITGQIGYNNMDIPITVYDLITVQDIDGPGYAYYKPILTQMGTNVTDGSLASLVYLCGSRKASKTNPQDTFQVPIPVPGTISKCMCDKFSPPFAGVGYSSTCYEHGSIYKPPPDQAIPAINFKLMHSLGLKIGTYLDAVDSDQTKQRPTWMSADSQYSFYLSDFDIPIGPVVEDYVPQTAPQYFTDYNALNNNTCKNMAACRASKFNSGSPLNKEQIYYDSPAIPPSVKKQSMHYSYIANSVDIAVDEHLMKEPSNYVNAQTVYGFDYDRSLSENLSNGSIRNCFLCWDYDPGQTKTDIDGV